MVGGHARRVAIAAMTVFAAKLAIGPVMQRATRPWNRIVSMELGMSIYMAEDIPDGWYGNWNQFDYTGTNITQRTGLSGNNITTSLDDGFYCKGNGICSGNVYGAGFNYACTQDNRTMDLRPRNENETVFKIDFDLVTDFGPPMLHILIDHVSTVDDDCTGTITTDSCYLIPATVRYPIRIVDTTINLDFDAHLADTFIVRNYTSEADIPPKKGEDLSRPTGPLKGTLDFLRIMFASEAILSHEGDKLGWRPPDIPHLVDTWTILYADGAAKEKYPPRCPIAFNPPTKDILVSATDYMFRSAYAAATRDEQNLQRFDATFSGTELRHITDFGWLAASVVVMVVGILAAMSLLWGWWQLGRYVTLSPLETGKAFGAPIFAGAGPEQEANDIIREIGQERVAHDGHELVWNGSVYATGLSSQNGGMRVMDSAPPGKSSFRSRTGAARDYTRVMSSIDEEEFQPVALNSAPAPAFAHSPGVSTKRWERDPPETNNVGRHTRHRSNSGGIGAGHEDTDALLPPLPPTMSFEQSYIAHFPPLRQGSQVGVEQRPQARFGTGRKATETQRRPLSPMYSMEPGTIREASPYRARSPAPSPPVTSPMVGGFEYRATSPRQPKRKLSLLEEISRRAPE
jgi:hypothetical protein